MNDLSCVRGLREYR